MTPKPLSQTGVFAFRTPAKPVFQVGKNLLLLFCVPDSGLCSGVLSDANGSPAELKEMLDNAFRHLLEHLGENPKPIQTKLFGVSHGDETLLRTAIQWLDQHGLKPTSRDLGRQFPRQVAVDIFTGRVAVTYGRAATAGGPELLTLGTARSRFTLSDAVQSVLVLSASPVERRLAQQAIEEYRDWEVEAPKDALKWLAERGAKPLAHALTLICAGSASELEIETFLAQHKNSCFAWIGPSLPDAFKGNPHVFFLGSLEPEFLSEFKGGLAELFRSMRTDAPLTATTGSRPKKARHS